MFDVGTLVWIEYEDDVSAIIGFLTDVGEDELELVQTHTYRKVFVPDLERIHQSVDNLSLEDLTEALMSGNLLDKLAVRRGHEAMVQRMIGHVATDVTRNGMNTLTVLPVREKMVVPRHGAVVRDGQVALYRITGYPDLQEGAEAEDGVDSEAEEERIEQAISDFSEQVEKYNKGELF